MYDRKSDLTGAQLLKRTLQCLDRTVHVSLDDDLEFLYSAVLYRIKQVVERDFLHVLRIALTFKLLAL